METKYIKMVMYNDEFHPRVFNHPTLKEAYSYRINEDGFAIYEKVHIDIARLVLAHHPDRYRLYEGSDPIDVHHTNPGKQPDPSNGSRPTDR